MIRLSVHPQNPQYFHIVRAAEVLHKGGLICYPTDTIYGIGCNLFNKNAIKKIYQLKGKSFSAPLSFICPNLKNIAKYAHVSTPAYKIMRRLLPGPYTFVLPATSLVPKIMLKKRRTVGIRVPDNKVCHMLLEEFGNPIISTSANDRSQNTLNDPDEIASAMNHVLDLFLDCGPIGLDPSSIIDLTEETPKIIREGKGSTEFLI